MDVNTMFSADQIAIPAELAPALRHYAKSVMRSEEAIAKTSLNKWTANYFAQLGGLERVFSDDGVLLQSSDAKAAKAPEASADAGDAAATDGFEPVADTSAGDKDKLDGTLTFIFNKYASDRYVIPPPPTHHHPPPPAPPLTSVRSGNIEKEQLGQLVADLREVAGLSLGEQEAMQILDYDGDGGISYKEFSSLCFSASE